jgi:hypothetical protein
MEKLREQITRRFHELDSAVSLIQVRTSGGQFPVSYIENEPWQKWSTSVLSLLGGAFGEDSVHYQNFKHVYDGYSASPSDLESARGVFHASKEDFEGGHVFSLTRSISGEIFGDFIVLAKQCIAEGNKDVSAVLACAALEDALKRFAKTHMLSVDDAPMQEVIAALKSRGLVSGAQKTLMNSMPRIRDYAMHANWEKISLPDASAVVSFVEQFLLANF